MAWLPSVTAADIEAGRMVTLVTMALVIGVGLIPPLRPHAYRIRIAVTLLYLLSAAGFTLYAVAFR